MIETATFCLALASFMEARGEPVKAQYAVMEVIHNRHSSDKFPNGYCNVIKQPNQFSWYKGNGSMKVPNKDFSAWNQSLEIANNFQQNKTNYVGKALYFNHNRLGVRYKTNVKPCKIGNHTFY